MKSLMLFLLGLVLSGQLLAQDFTKLLTTARSSYSSGKLDDARFAMQQLLNELDILTGKEILALLPQKMDNLAFNPTNDNVSGTSGFMGVLIHREYGKGTTGSDENKASVEIITNSPMVSALNSMLSLPFMNNNPDQKVIKINGYKAMIQKVSGSNDRTDYEMQLPLNSTLITLKAPGLSQDKVIALANSLPIAEIAKRVQ
jgi:hypothetical protein